MIPRDRYPHDTKEAAERGWPSLRRPARLVRSASGVLVPVREERFLVEGETPGTVGSADE